MNCGSSQTNASGHVRAPRVRLSRRPHLVDVAWRTFSPLHSATGPAPHSTSTAGAPASAPQRMQNLQVRARQRREPSIRLPLRRGHPSRACAVSSQRDLLWTHFVRFALRRLPCADLTCFLAAPVLRARLGACYQTSLRGEAPGQRAPQPCPGPGRLPHATSSEEPPPTRVSSAASAILRPEPNFLRVEAPAQATIRAARCCSIVSTLVQVLRAVLCQDMPHTQHAESLKSEPVLSPTLRDFQLRPLQVLSSACMRTLSTVIPCHCVEDDSREALQAYSP